jgi:nitroreductase
MPLLDLTPDQLLLTTRAVRKRLDLSRPVEAELLRECIEMAVQAPSGSNTQRWHFCVVTDAAKRRALADFYRQGVAKAYGGSFSGPANPPPTQASADAHTLQRVRSSAQYLADHMHEVPVHVIPCIQGRPEGLSASAQAGMWGSILPAAWSFMLAARARGLGTAWTSLHLIYEREAAEVLGIPYEQITQAALIPVAYTLGTDFKPGPRKPLEEVIHLNEW